MATTQLNVRIEEELASYLRETAGEAGLTLADYVGRLAAADRAARTGSPEAREARALAFAAAEYQRWNNAGRSEAGAMNMGEVFG
ncbi:hypothetical protein ABIA33_007000 [Streptacidiphilus sp. MAP12-16]|uniref:hypothetical protein n=1 Tax=Streptacidiphilus sp. MAP12-16 TaxID=3156300 RepID=UPI003517D262